MKFCGAQVRAVKAKIDWLGISFSSTRTLTMVTPWPATAARANRRPSPDRTPRKVS